MCEDNKDKQTYELITRWLEAYKISTDKYERAKLKALIVTRMLSIIKKIARTIARRSYDPIDDLVQAGSIGLLKAIESYSAEVNDNFKIYAGYLIIGEMKHYLRDKLNTIRVPGHIQELSYRINTFTNSLTYEQLNELTNDDVAEALKVTPRAVDYAMQADRRKSVVSLENIFSDADSLSYEEVLSAHDDYKEASENVDDKIVLKDVIEKLPDEYRKLVEMYYYDDMNQKDIAEKLGMTQMRISRKMKKAFSMLYKMIADNSDEV
ncbi:sigma-70 family RNA polymerase sigma factor [bacterium]|nr:sigma-70 family RNA polymerase sigma factor [bacterium]